MVGVVAYVQLMAVVYVGFAVAWMSEMARLHEYVLRIHYLCLSCVLAKFIEMVLWAAYYDRQVHKKLIKSICPISLFNPLELDTSFL